MRRQKVQLAGDLQPSRSSPSFLAFSGCPTCAGVAPRPGGWGHPAESNELSKWIREVVPVPNRPCVRSGGARSRIGNSAGCVWRWWPRCNCRPSDDQYHVRDRSSQRAEPPRRRAQRRGRNSGPGHGDAGSGRSRYVGERCGRKRRHAGRHSHGRITMARLYRRARFPCLNHSRRLTG